MNYKSTKTEEMFFHIRTPLIDKWKLGALARYKGATVFYRKDTAGWWRHAVSLCSPKDNWCKKTGRTVARRRFFCTKNYSNGTLGHKPTYADSFTYAVNAARARG